MDYESFLREKIPLASFNGYACEISDINPLLREHQSAIVQWAVKGGNRALFEAFGLGKTLQQIEIIRITRAFAGGKALIVCPLGVRQEFRRDGIMDGEQWEDRAADLGYDIAEIRERFGVDFKFIRRSAEVVDGHDYYLTNYESIRDGKLDVSLFTVVSLDEASILRSYGSKTFQEFLPLFKNVKHKFVATATPSPNRFKELIHYAGFLGIMDTGQALTRFFQRDSTQANNLTLYPHKEQEFWLWLNSWSIFLQSPSDLGYDSTGYDLPEMTVIYHEVPTDHAMAGTDPDGQGLLFVNAAAGLSAASKEKRSSLDRRIDKMREILANDPDSHYIIWHDLEVERRAISKVIPSSVAVYGSQDLEKREQAIIDFSDGKFQYFSAKPVIAGSGCNFQRHCHKAIFLGVGYKFNDFIQSIHRISRFLQRFEVEIHIIYSEAEQDILRVLQEKWANHKKLVENMTEIIKKNGLNELSLGDILSRSIGCERIQADGEWFSLANNDCVIEAQRQPNNHCDMIVTSIPFSNHYEYTPSYNDFGHTDNNGHFWDQMDFLTPELWRILKPGRIYACHVKDRILFGNVTGAGIPTVSPFHCEAIMHGRKHGFDYMGMITVVTDVVRENNQTYRLGWTEQCKDSTKMGVGSPEYIILFHKPQTERGKGYADEPVKKEKSSYTRARWQVDAHAFWKSSGNRLLTPEDLENVGPGDMATLFTEYTQSHVYDYDYHIKVGETLEGRGKLPASFMSIAPGSWSPDVWTDVNRMLTLNSAQIHNRAMLHVCPLQFDIVDRLITRYSNKGDLIYDPFCGLGTVPFRAVKLGRRGQGSELNTQYFLDSVQYLQAAERAVTMPSLFDMVGGDA